MSALERFIAKVSFGECWEWRGAIMTSGYGNFSIGRRFCGAHRWSYEQWEGPIPNGAHIDHLCRNRKCVRPEHLEAVSCQENILRGTGLAAVNHRKTHCPRGHEYNQKNTRVYRGGRICRSCDNSRRQRGVKR